MHALNFNQSVFPWTLDRPYLFSYCWFAYLLFRIFSFEEVEICRSASYI